MKRISIRSLMAFIVVTAIGLAAIRSGSAAWAGATLSTTFFALVSSFLGIALGRGRRRVFWSGFALLGWSYLILVYTPWLNEKVGRFLLAPNLFVYLVKILHPEPLVGGMQSIPPSILGAAATGGGFDPGEWSVRDLSDFERFGVALEALLWAFLGGWTAIYFASGRTDGDQHAGSTGCWVTVLSMVCQAIKAMAQGMMSSTAIWKSFQVEATL